MDKIRIGKDIRINWEIETSDESVILSKDNLTLEMTVPSKCVAVLPFTFNDNVLSATFYGIDQKQLGNYWLTVWYKRNEVGQSALDKVLAFQLVRSTEEETHNDDSIAYAEVNLSGTIEINKGGGGVNLEYYTEDTEIGEAKIDNGTCSIDCYKDDGGTISIIATHTDIHDDGRNSQLTVGGGVSINTKNGNRLTYNNFEVATKSDVSNCATKSELNAHTNNTNIHVSAEDKTRWNAKQDSGDFATNTYVNTELEKKQNIGDYALRSELPTVGDATITIQKNGTSVGNFKTNATANKSINITVPTTVASLTDSDDYYKKGEGIGTVNATLEGSIRTAQLFSNKRTTDFFVCANALSGRFDFLYCAHLKPSVIITSSKVQNPTYMFNGDMATDALIKNEYFATLSTDPAIIELTWDNLARKAVISDTTYLMLLNHQMQNGDYLTNYQVEIYSVSSSSNSPFYGNDGWNTVLRRENVRDQVNGLIIPLGLTKGYSTIKGIRITIYGIEHVVSWTTHFPICEIKMIDSRPSFTAAQGLGGLDIIGGDVYGNTKFYGGIEGDLSGTINGYSITNVTALPSNPNANTIYLITD